VNAVDVTAGASGNSRTTNSGTANTTAANELIFGANTVATGATGAGSGFTVRIITKPDKDLAEDAVVTAIGSYSATGPVSPSGPWVMQMVTFKPAAGPAPTVSGIAPSSGPAAGGTGVTITGTNFVSGASVTFGGTAATNVVVVSGTQITATTSAHAAGAVTVTVTNPDTQSGSLTNGFTYVAAPTVSNVVPNSGPAAGGTGVTITGTNFVSGASVTFGGGAATNVVVVSGTQITATTPAHAGGAVNVVVTNPDTQSGTLVNGFTYTSGTAPTVSSVSPNSGPAAGGTGVTITGTNFVSGATVTFGGTAATNVVVVNGTTITATTAAHAAGAVTVTVTNPDTQSGSLANGFTYAAAPTVASVTPNNGLAAGGTNVTIAGTGFVNGATVTFGGTAATNVVVVNGTTITATTPAHAAGAVTVTVTNPDTQGGSLTNGFTYNAAVAIGFAQVAAATPQTPTQVVTVTYPGAQTIGDLNVVVVGWNDTSSTVVQVSDSAGNNYSLAIGPTTGTGLRQSIYYAANIKGGSNTVTVQFNQPAQFADVRILEYRGVNAVDVTAGASGNSTTANSGTANTTAANELIFGANMVSTFTGGAGSGFTSRVITTPDGDIAEDRVVTAMGSYSATAAVSPSGPWVMQMVTFK
jgi:CTP:molybdopterin cytidylyltransferase MocA